MVILMATCGCFGVDMCLTQDPNAAIECARKALEQNLPPLVPQELTKEAHARRVREIFEPWASAAILQQ